MTRCSLFLRVLGALAALGLAVGGWALATVSPAAATTYATANGQGSTYAALAFQQWTQAEQLQGLNVNYTATGSPAGLQSYEQNTADFAGTEAEYSELYADTKNGTPNTHVPRGFAYTPDVAGAVAIMYNVAINPTGSDPVDYLHLSRMTVARIFMGIIKNWDSPTISADNHGLQLPNKPIKIDYRSGQSGTTALFYDFVKNTDPTQFVPWAQANGWTPNLRIWEIDQGIGGFPTTNNSIGFPGSTQQAQAVASPGGLWSIGYDEFGYAKVYHDNVAWIGNAAGMWVQPYALNIAAALQSAVLAPDTSQTLKGVYASTNPLAYPISAYSYILYQCAPTPDRPTCKTPYTNPGIEATMAKFMRYVACTGQVKMATIGYSPLPVQLSQFMANAIGYMTGQPAPTLTASNCANPQFQGGSLGVGAQPPPDPTAGVTTEAPPGSRTSSGGTQGSGGHGATAAGATSSGGTSAGGGGTGTHRGTARGAVPGSTAAGTSDATTATSAGSTGTTVASGSGGSAAWSSPAPIAYLGPTVGSGSPWPLLTLVAVLFLAAGLLSWRGRRQSPASRAAPAPADPVGSPPGGSAAEP